MNEVTCNRYLNCFKGKLQISTCSASEFGRVEGRGRNVRSYKKRENKGNCILHSINALHRPFQRFAYTLGIKSL